MKEIPYVAFGNDELGASLKKGDSVKCHKCKWSHRIELGINEETKLESNLLMFYRCGNESYLAGIKGQAVP